eukprot:1137379-Rhodomonas_salina.1
MHRLAQTPYTLFLAETNTIHLSLSTLCTGNGFGSARPGTRSRGSRPDMRARRLLGLLIATGTSIRAIQYQPTKDFSSIIPQLWYQHTRALSTSIPELQNQHTSIPKPLVPAYKRFCTSIGRDWFHASMGAVPNSMGVVAS